MSFPNAKSFNNFSNLNPTCLRHQLIVAFRKQKADKPRPDKGHGRLSSDDDVELVLLFDHRFDVGGVVGD